MQTEADYRSLIDRHLMPLADRAQAVALAAWEAGDEEKGIQVLAEAAMAEPHNPSLPLLLAKLLIRQGRHPDAHAVLAALPAPLRSGGEIRRLYTHLELIMTARDGGHAGNAGAVPGATARDGGHAGNAGAVPGATARDGGHAGDSVDGGGRAASGTAAEDARPASLRHAGHVQHPRGTGATPGPASLEAELTAALGRTRTTTRPASLWVHAAWWRTTTRLPLATSPSWNVAPPATEMASPMRHCSWSWTCWGPTTSRCAATAAPCSNTRTRGRATGPWLPTHHHRGHACESEQGGAHRRLRQPWLPEGDGRLRAHPDPVAGRRLRRGPDVRGRGSGHRQYLRLYRRGGR